MGGGMSKIVPGIYVGGLAAAKSKTHLAAHHISHICTVLHQDVELVSPNIKHLIFKVDDSATENIAQYFEEACFFIHDARVNSGSVLIHCACGVSRSVTVTLAYLLIVTDFSLSDLFKAVQGARHCACPNYGFMDQLSHFETHDAIILREKLCARFGEWPADKRAADTEALNAALEVQNYYILRGEYPGQRSLENVANEDNSSMTSSAEGKAIFEESRPLVRPLSCSYYTVYSNGKPRKLEDFLATRSKPSEEASEETKNPGSTT